MRRIRLRDRKKRVPGYAASTRQPWDLNLEGPDCKAYPGKIDSCLYIVEVVLLWESREFVLWMMEYLCYFSCMIGAGLKVS